MKVAASSVDFPALMDRVRAGEFVGGNITVPHKAAAYENVDQLQPMAARLGAVNTVWARDGQLFGDNTDSYGFTANLDACVPGWDQSQVAVIIGAGGAARAIAPALADRGFSDIRIANRTIKNAEILCARIGQGASAHPLIAVNELTADAGLIVNTTSLGLNNAGTPDIDFAAANPAAIVTDIVYVPLATSFLATARKHQLQTVDGLGMLLHQAAPGFERWYGILPEVTQELRELVEADIVTAA